MLPVNIDNSGANLRGDERISRSLSLSSGEHNWASDSEITPARLVIDNVNHAPSSLLRFDSRFELVYIDQIAAVFVSSAKAEGG